MRNHFTGQRWRVCAAAKRLGIKARADTRPSRVHFYAHAAPSPPHTTPRPAHLPGATMSPPREPSQGTTGDVAQAGASSARGLASSRPTPPPLQVPPRRDTDTLASPSSSRPFSPAHSRMHTPKSAIIDLPSDWGGTSASPGTSNASNASNAASRGSFDSDMRLDPGYPVSISARGCKEGASQVHPNSQMSPSSSSSSSNPLFAWPEASSSRLHQPSLDPSRERSDPFEQGFDPRRSASIDSWDDSRPSSIIDPDLPIHDDAPRESVTMIPHHIQVRAASDPHVDGIVVDPEFSASHSPEFTFDSDGLAPSMPAFNRTFSAPLPSRVGFLRHPLSPLADPLNSYSAHSLRHDSISSVLSRPSASSRSTGSTTLASDGEESSIQTLSLELADSVQSAIQTLLHLSPPHILDNAKEQYSGCSVQMPTTSLSALLTAMKSLNFFSANAQTFMEGAKGNGLLGRSSASSDFDIGELLQSIADLLSGQAAQAGVDLVLFHGDVGIKHVSVGGDSEGLGYLLAHVSRARVHTDPDHSPNPLCRICRRYNRTRPAARPAIPVHDAPRRSPADRCRCRS